MLLADRPRAEQAIGQWGPGHLSESVVTQTLLITFVAHREAAKREVKHIRLKKLKKKSRLKYEMLNFCKPWCTY